MSEQAGYPVNMFNERQQRRYAQALNETLSDRVRRHFAGTVPLTGSGISWTGTRFPSAQSGSRMSQEAHRALLERWAELGQLRAETARADARVDAELRHRQALPGGCARS